MTTRHISRFILILASGVGLGTNFNDGSFDRILVPYPDGYRKWTHIKTEAIGPKSPAYPRFGGYHHIYGNEKAMEGYSAGRFPDGAVLVFDVLELIEKENGNAVEGKRKFIDVMMKDRANYESTGGWGFEEFDGNSASKRNVGETEAKPCFNCHATQKQSDYVFSSFRN